MCTNNIFIHIPKTGGSSFVRTLQVEVLKEDTFLLDNTHAIKKILNIDIKHVDFSHPNRPMRDSDIFAKYNLYKDYNIFTIIRNPLERLISEFIFQYHILKPKWKAARIINSLVPRPTTFEEYVKHMEVWNYQLAFLSGRGLADKNKPNQKDLDNIIYHFNKYPVYCGVTDNYDEFINLFNKKSGYEIKNIHKMKEAPNDIKTDIYNSLPQELIDYIKKTNSLDYKLYEYAKKSQLQHP